MSEGSKTSMASVALLAFLSGSISGGLSAVVAISVIGDPAAGPAAPVATDAIQHDVDLLTNEIALTQHRVALLEALPLSIETYSKELVEHAVGEVDVRFDMGGRVRNARLYPFTEFHKSVLIKGGLITPAELKP